MSPIIIAIYLVLCFMVGLLGYRTRLGFFRSFLFSVLLTPFVITIFLLILTTLGPEPKTGANSGATGNKNA